MEEKRIFDLVLVKYGLFLVNCGNILVKCGRFLEFFGIDVSKMTLACGRILQFQCPKESSYLKNNTYNKYKPYNTTRVQNFGSIIFV